VQPALMKSIKEYRVDKNAMAVWWLGQNGYIFKSPESSLVSVDLYLSHSCKREYPKLNLRRKVPVLIAPEEVEVDLYACTHNHLDHLDPDTIHALRNKDTVAFVGAGQCEPLYRSAGVESSRIQTVWPSAVYQFKDARLTATFALPTDTTELNHLGFVLQFGDGPKLYITGDTDHHPLLYAAAEHHPDAMITCINGGFNNLSHWEAADLASNIKPRIAIPCHYDMFEDNQSDPHQFEVALKQLCPDTAYLKMNHGEPFLLRKDG
jgi:L-ascorbate 6-phosphate lactonase